jgi:hypothetical protein
MDLLSTSIRGAYNAYSKYGFGRNFMGRIIKLGRKEFSDEILGKYSAYITQFNDPGAQRQPLDTSYLGKRFVFPGVLEYNNLDSWTVTFKMSEGLGIKTIAEQELLRLGDANRNISLTPCASDDEIIIATLDETGNIVRAKRLMSAFLLGVDDTTYDLENVEIQSLTLTFGYQMWEPYALSDAISISDFNVNLGDAFPGDADNGTANVNYQTLQSRYEQFKQIIDARAKSKENCKVNI